MLHHVFQAAGVHFLPAGETWVGPTTAGMDWKYLNATFADGNHSNLPLSGTPVPIAKVLQPPSRRYSYPSLAGIPTPDTETPLPPYTQAPHTRCTHILRYTLAPTTLYHHLLLSAYPYHLSLVLHFPSPHIHPRMFSFLPNFFFLRS